MVGAVAFVYMTIRKKQTMSMSYENTNMFMEKPHIGISQKTVRVPSPESASTRPAALTVATRVENISFPAAMSTMLELTEAGVKTVSMPWIIPLSASMSTRPSSMIIFELSLTRGGSRLMVMFLPLSVDAARPRQK